MKSFHPEQQPQTQAETNTFTTLEDESIVDFEIPGDDYIGMQVELMGQLDISAENWINGYSVGYCKLIYGNEEGPQKAGDTDAARQLRQLYHKDRNAFLERIKAELPNTLH